MVAHIAEISPPLTFTLIAGGRSNLTYRVEDATGRAWALRRPPLHHVLPTAHDMSREYRLMHSLGPVGIPVPVTVGLCTDESVNERPFYVMEFVEGHILRTAPEAEAAFDEATRRAVGDHMADTLAALHDVDPDAVGLGDLGRHEGYIERQLKRWRGQYDQMQVEGVDHGTIVEKVSDELGPAHPQATADLRGARGLPDGQRGAGRRRDGPGHPRLGDLHPRRPARRRRSADGLLDRPDRLDVRSGAVAHDGPGLLQPGRGPGALRLGVGPRHLGDRLLHGVRVLEAGLHPAGCLRPLRRRRGAGDHGSVEGFPVQIGRLFEMAGEALETVP